MFLGRHALPRCAGSQGHRPAAVAHRSTPSTFLAARRRLKATLSTPPHVEKPLLPRQQTQATASSHAGAQQTQHVEYQVAGSTFSVSFWGGTGSRQQPLLRLQEQSDVSEYVLVLPQSLSGVLHEVLEKAVRCVETGNDGKPLELHHTILQGSKSFRCSLVYDPTAGPISSTGGSGGAAVAGLASGPQQQVEVTVHELGRSCVHLPVCSAVLEPVKQLLQLLQGPPQQQAVPVGPAVSPRHQGEAVAATTIPAAGPDVTAGNGNGSSHLISVPADAAAAQRTGLADDSAPDAAANDGEVELAGLAAAASSSSLQQQQQQQPLPDAAGHHSPCLAAATVQSEPKTNSAEAASEVAAAVLPLAAAAANSHSSFSVSITSLPEFVQQDLMGAADGNGKPSEAGAAAASQQDDVASGEHSSSAPAAAAAASPAASRAAPEVLFDAINSSSALKDAFKFAYAAAAESLDSSNNSSSSSASRVFQLPHLCVLWQKLPSYAAGLQREVLQVGPDVEDDEVMMSAGPLYPEAQQELQALVDVLVPILQPQLPQLPRHMLQRLLQAAADASVQLPDSFLAAWAAAAAAPAARGSWEGEGPAALLDVSLLLMGVQARPQQQQQQIPLQLPLQWCAYALEEACQHIQQAQPQLLGHMWGDAAADEAAVGASQEDVNRLHEELVPVVLAACGHQLQQQQLLWRPWGHSSSTTDTGASASGTAALTAAWLASIAQSLQQLLGAASAQNHKGLQDIESALLPGLQQRRMLQSVLVLVAQQHAAAVALIWSWLAFGGGARDMSSDLLRTLLEQLPYDDAAAAYTAATQEAAAAGGSAGSPDAAAAAVHRAGKPAEHSSLLEHVLHAHTQSRRNAGPHQSTELLQLESVSGLLGLALQIDVRAAFAALPSLLSALPHSAPAGSNTAAGPSAGTSSSGSSTGQQWDAAVALLCDQLQHMLQLGPQQLLSCALVALKALTQLSTAPSATPQSILCLLQLAQQLANTADSWHDAAASPQLQELQPEVASEQLAQGAAAEQQVPTAAEVVECCWGSVPMFAQAYSAVLQQDGQQLLPHLAELLQAAAALQDAYGDHRSLQPDWLTCQVAPPPTSAAGAEPYSSSSTSSSGSLWADFGPVLLATAAQSGTNALDAADVAAAASALLQLGLPPSEQLLQAYWDALDPEALGLTAVGLQQLLWITAALVHQQQQQTKTASHTAHASSSSSGSHMLRLATKACSSLSVRSASALSARQAARVTWALASLACSDAAAAAGWTPPQQILSWLRRVWQGMDAASGRGGTSNSSSRFGASADGVVLGLQAKVLQLQEEHILHQQEAGELQWALQQLGLLPQQAAAKWAQAEHQQQQEEDVQNSPAAVAEVQPQQQQDQEQEIQQQPLHEELSTLHKPAEQLLHQALQEGGDQQTIPAKQQQEKQQQQQASGLPQQPLQSATQHLQQQQQQQQQQRPSVRPLSGKDGTHRLLQQQQLLRQGQAGWDQASSRYTVHDFAAQQPAPAAPARTASVAPPQPAAAGHLATAPTVVEAVPSVVRAAAAPAAAGEAEVAQASSTAAAVPSTPAEAAEALAAAVPQAAEPSTTELAPHQQGADNTAAAGANADSADVETADAPAAAAETAESASTAPVLEADAASPPAAAAAAAELSGVISAAAAAGAVTPVPPSVAAALQQLKEPSFNPTQKQAMQLLLPVQQHIAALSPSEILLYAASCFKHKVPMSSSALLTVGTTAAAACSAAQTGSAGQGETTEVAFAPASLLLQLLSATAAAIAAPVGTLGAEAASEAEAAGTLKQRAPHILQQLLPVLSSQQLVLLSASELLQLLREVFTISTGQRPPKATVLPVGSTLFGPTALSSNASSSDGNGAGPAVDVCWLESVAEVLRRKLLLFPHGSQLLQSLQLLQALGLRQPSSSFMASFLEAADALLDTLSGRNCLELLAAVAAAGTLPSKAIGAALLQHLVPLKLSPTDVAAGCRLLAALSIRPSAELLLRWFDTTEAAVEQLQPSGVLQMLWACCVWQVQPPTTWLEAVVKSLLPVGRLTSCSPATLAGLCRCLWQLGVQPAPGFVAAVAAAAEYSMTAAQGQSGGNGSSSSSGSWAYWQQGRQQQAQPDVPSMDAESLSVLCYCFHSWQHSGTPAWWAAVAERAAALMNSADGLSLLRLALYLAAQEHDQEGLYDDADELLPWQQTLLTALPQLLHSTAHAAGQEGILAADGAAEVSRLPAWTLVVLAQVLSTVPDQSFAVLRGMITASKASAEQELLTSWDILALWPSYKEFLEGLQHSAETATGPLAGVKVNQLQQEAEAALGTAQHLLKYAYQQRAGAPAVVLEAIPMLAADLGIDMPQQSRSILQAAVAAARQREEQLQQALLLQEQGGPAVPESLLQGLSELKPDDGDIVIAQYARSPLQAALGRRLSWLGAAVSDDWVVRGLSNT